MPQEEEHNIIVADSSREATIELVRQLMPLLLDVPGMSATLDKLNLEGGPAVLEGFAAGAYSLAALILSGRVTIGVDEISKPF